MAGKKCTAAEKKARLEALADLIVKGYSQRKLIRHVRDTWGLSEAQTTIYIRESRDLVKAEVNRVERADMLAAKIQQLEDIAIKSVDSGQHSNAIGAIRLLNELVGFGGSGR